MKYRLEITPKAEKEYSKLPALQQAKTRARILALEEDPHPYGSKKLKNTDFFRIRIGDFRVVYSVDDKERLVKILSIGHRKDVYR